MRGRVLFKQKESMKRDVVTDEVGVSSGENAVAVLAKSIARWTEQGEQHTTAVPGLSLFRREEPTEPITGMYEPSICLVAQGANPLVQDEEGRTPLHIADAALILGNPSVAMVHAANLTVNGTVTVNIFAAADLARANAVGAALELGALLDDEP